MLTLLTEVVDKLIVYPDNMMRNLERTQGLVFSESVLLALTKKGMKREDAYQAVQSAAMKTWESHSDFKKVLLSNKTIRTTLNNGELDELFELKKSLQSVDHIFQRVGLS
jgi:adenylosuccinate lyase